MLLHRDPKGLWLAPQPWAKIGPPHSGRPQERAGLRRLLSGSAATCCAGARSSGAATTALVAIFSM